MRAGRGGEDGLFITWTHATVWMGIKFPGGSSWQEKGLAVQEGSSGDAVILKATRSSPRSYILL